MATKKEKEVEETRETKGNELVEELIADRVQIIGERSQLQVQLSNLLQQKADLETNIRALESQRDEGTGMLRFLNTKLIKLGYNLDELNARMQQGPPAPEETPESEEGEETE